jgi:hypothetical protein
MSKVALSFFPAHVPIGQDATGVKIYSSPEFSRALSSVLERIGGAIGMSVDDLALLASTVTQPDQVARRAAADALAAPAIDQGAMIAALISKIAALQAQVAQIESTHAEIAKLRKLLVGVELQAAHHDPYRVNWERPGRIGYFTANTGAFTALTANTFNKVTITAPATGSTFTLDDGATLSVPAPGGTLDSAAYQPSSAFAARSSTSLGAAPTDPASTQSAVITIQNVLKSVGIGT